MMEFPAWLATGSLATIGGSFALGVLWLIGKWMDKHKPAHEVLDGIAESLRETIDHLNVQIHAADDDLQRLRAEARRLSILAHRYNMAVQDCCIDHPATTSWWGKRLREIES